MAKITKYFKNQAEYDAYWQGEQPGSKYLCIIQDSGVEGLDNVLVTTSNNAPNSDGEQQEMGGSTIDIISEQAETIANQAETIAEQEGIIADSVSMEEYNTVVDELNDATDITYDITGEVRLEDGWYYYSDSGNYYKMHNDDNPNIKWIIIEDTDWDLPGYFVLHDVENNLNYSYYPQTDGDVDFAAYKQTHVTKIVNDENYSENRFVLGKEGKKNGALQLIYNAFGDYIISWHANYRPY